jgi:phytoene desaturase
MTTVHDADVIVVGAGTGGLTAAAYLAVAGRRVVVVDRGHSPGGHAIVFSRDGYEFDVGLHYLGSHRDGTPATTRMLEPLGVQVEYNRIDPVDTIVLPDGTVEIPTGLEAFRANLHAALPQERAAVDRYLNLIDSVDAGLAALTRVRGPRAVPGAAWQARALLQHRGDTLGQVFDRLGLSPRARTLLGWISFVYAVPPADASFLMHAMVTMHYVHGAWYPRGGGPVISEGLAEVIRAHGGRFLMDHEVTRIQVQGGRVVGVQARDPQGALTTLTAPVVVSNADIKHTFLDLLDPEVVPRPVRRKIRGYEMSLPLGIVYAVIDRDLGAEGVPVTNYLVTRDNIEDAYRSVRRGEFPEDPPVWVTTASLKDPGNERLCRPGQTNLQLMSLVPPQPHAWGLARGEQRGRAYTEAKDQFRDQLLAAADRAIPGLSDAVVYADVATPFTVQRYTAVTDGTSYGIAATPDQMMNGRPAPKTHIPGLFLVGASTRSGHGITGVMQGGIATATAVLGRSAVTAART